MSLVIHCISHGIDGQTVIHGSLRFNALFDVSRTRRFPGNIGFGVVCIAYLFLLISPVSSLKTLSLDISTCNRCNLTQLVKVGFAKIAILDRETKILFIFSSSSLSICLITK